MTPIVAIVLGFIEGATEFLPISSSGHLIIARQLLGVNDFGGLSFDAVIQLATTLAILVYFWRDIVRLIITFLIMVFQHTFFGAYVKRWHDETNFKKDETLLWAMVVGTIPAVVFGLMFETYMDTVFRNVDLVAITLILGSGLFWVAQKLATKDKVLTLGKGIAIGFFQCLALVPGVSRSGATISGGLLTGLSQEEAVRFSFLLSIPILLGAGLKKLFEVRRDLVSSGLGTMLLLSSVVAFVTGLLAINFLIRYLKNHDLNVFIYYRIALAIAIFLIF